MLSLRQQQAVRKHEEFPLITDRLIIPGIKKEKNYFFAGWEIKLPHKRGKYNVTRQTPPTVQSQFS